MDKPKRAKRIINNLDTIYSYLEYYMNGHTGLTPQYQEIKKYIEELSLDQKEHNIRFAKKLKWFNTGEE